MDILGEGVRPAFDALRAMFPKLCTHFTDNDDRKGFKKSSKPDLRDMFAASMKGRCGLHRLVLDADREAGSDHRVGQDALDKLRDVSDPHA